MAAGTVIKHKRKAGAFVNGELAAGEKGLDVTSGTWYFSRNGTTVETVAGGSGDMLKSEYATNGQTGKVDTAINAEKLGDVTASQYASKAYADAAAASAAAALADSAPAALDTLNELATALGNDANFATTITNALAGKAALSHTHNAADVNAGDLASARMQANVAAALQAGGGTLNSQTLIIDGGAI
jgi:hypothetical protein